MDKGPNTGCPMVHFYSFRSPVLFEALTRTQDWCLVTEQPYAQGFHNRTCQL